jgi:O-antigen/teichoic acid export membrane protein
MSLKRILVRNIASNWAGYAFQVAIAFFLTPFILHALGEARYGVWTLAIGLTGYYGLLDLGFSAGVTQYLTRYLAARDIESLNRTASSGVVALTCCGTAVLIGSLVIAFNASAIFQIPASAATEVALVIAIMGVSVAMQFGFFTYSAVFTAVQRFDLSNGIGVATRILSAGATVVCLKSGYSLVGLSLVVAGTNVIDYLIRWSVAGRLLPAMKISLKLVSRESLREVVSFGLWNSVSAGSVRLISYTDALVIAAFMPVAAVAPFAIAANLRAYFEDLFVRAGFVFFPAVTELDAKGDEAGLRQLYLKSSRYIFLGSILLGVIAILSAQDFFRLWVGPAAEPSGYPSIASIFYVLIVASMISVAQRVGYQVLLGTRRVKLLALLFAAEGVSNLVISLALVRNYGLIGVALGTFIPATVFQGVVQPLIICRALQITSKTYCREVLQRPIFIALAIVPLLLVLSDLMLRSYNWMILLLNISLSMSIAIPVVLVIGLTKTERDLYLVRPTTEALRFLGAVGVTRN